MSFCSSNSKGCPSREIRCRCKRRAVVRVSKTADNNGRKFYGCSKWTPHGGGCTYFRWVDDSDDDDVDEIGHDNASSNLMHEMMTEVNMLLRENRELRIAQVLMKCSKPEIQCERCSLLEEKLKVANSETRMYKYIIWLFVAIVVVLMCIGGMK